MPAVSRSSALTSLNRKTSSQADSNLIGFEEHLQGALRQTRVVNDLVFDSTEWPKENFADRSLDSGSVEKAQQEGNSVELSERNKKYLQYPGEQLRVKVSNWVYDETQIDRFGGDFRARTGKIVSNFPVTPRPAESRWTELQIQRAGFGDKSRLPEEIVPVHEGRGARDCESKAGIGRHKGKTDCVIVGNQDGNNSQNVTMGENSGDSFAQRRVRSRMLDDKPEVRRTALGVQRPVGGSKDRHSKVNTAKGLRDRRVRLSATTAIQFFDVQDRLGYDQPSKAVDWLIKKARAAIDELAPAQVAGRVTSAGDARGKDWAAGWGGSDEGGGGRAEEGMEESGGKMCQEEAGGAGGGRAESRARARERARVRVKERSNSSLQAPPLAADSSPPPLEAAQNLHLVPELYLLSQPILSSDHSALIRPSAAPIPPPPPPSNPLSPPDFSLLPPSPASFLNIPSASPQLLHFPPRFLHLSSPSPSPSFSPPPFLFHDLPTPYDRPRPSSLHLSSSSSAASSLPGPGPPSLPGSSVISTRGTLQSIFNPVSSLSQAQSVLIEHDAAQGCESGFHATSPTGRTSMMSTLNIPSSFRVIHGLENAKKETRTPSSSMYLH